MNLKSSQTDWEALEKMNDEDIDLSDIPEVTADQIAQATLRVGGKPVLIRVKTNRLS